MGIEWAIFMMTMLANDVDSSTAEHISDDRFDKIVWQNKYTNFLVNMFQEYFLANMFHDYFLLDVDRDTWTEHNHVRFVGV